MKELFNMDNGLFRFLGRVADLMILNILFIVCSIPIITIGASITGMYYVTLKIAENEEGYIVRGFFKSFKQNFKQATVIWLIILGVGIVLVMDLMIMRNSDSTFGNVLWIAITALCVIYLVITSYVFPTLARFYNSIKNTFRNSFLMSIAHLPYTLLILVITVAPVILTFINGYTLWYGLLLWLLFGFSAIAYGNSFFLKRIFAKYMPPQEESQEDPDHWVVEETEEMKKARSARFEEAADQQAAHLAELKTVEDTITGTKENVPANADTKTIHQTDIDS